MVSSLRLESEALQLLYWALSTGRAAVIGLEEGSLDSFAALALLDLLLRLAA